jgi:hypothetical protein
MLTSYPVDKASIYLNTGAEVGVTGVKVSSDEQHKIIAKMLIRDISFFIR